jgi:hypothetical protein
MKIRRSLFNMSDVAWFDHPHGDHVLLPLDVSRVSDAVVEKVAMHIAAHHNGFVVDDKLREGWPGIHVRVRFEYEGMARAAITALAAALGEEG